MGKNPKVADRSITPDVVARTVAVPEYDTDDQPATIRIRDPRFVTLADPGLAGLHERYLKAVAAVDPQTGDGVVDLDRAVAAIVHWFVLDVAIDGIDPNHLPERIVNALADLAMSPFRPTELTSASTDTRPSADTSSEAASG